MIDHNKESRRLFFAKALEGFIQAKFPTYTISANGTTYGVSQLADAETIINDYYWDIVENNLKPLLETVNDESNEEAEKRIDLYKILSATEFAVMSCKPFFLTNADGTELEYTADNNYVNEDTKINSSFAVHCALNILLGWEGYKPIISEAIVNQIFDYKEQIDKRKNAMNIIDEHKAILEYTNLMIGMTILTNATWWRMFCFAAFISTDNQINLSKYKQ